MKRKNFKLPLSGHIIDVQWVEDLIDDHEASGDWSHENWAIRLDSGLTKPEAQAILIHECSHAVSDVYGLKLEENQIRVLAEGLQQMLAKFLKEIK